MDRDLKDVLKWQLGKCDLEWSQVMEAAVGSCYIVESSVMQ